MLCIPITCSGIHNPALKRTGLVGSALTPQLQTAVRLPYHHVVVLRARKPNQKACKVRAESRRKKVFVFCVPDRVLEAVCQSFAAGHNAMQFGVPHALTRPVWRGDVETMRAQQRALKQVGKVEMKKAYAMMLQNASALNPTTKNAPTQ